MRHALPHRSLVALFCTKLVKSVKAAGQSPGAAVGQSPSSWGSGAVGLSVSSGEFPGTAAASRTCPPTSCPLPSVSGRRESAAAPGEFLGQARSVRALPAVTPPPAAVATPRRAPRANSWGSTCRHGHSRPAAAVTAALATPRPAFRANSRDSSRQLGRIPGPMAVAVGPLPTRVIYRIHAPAARPPRCPVVPLEIVDELRAPGAGSIAAGRPAPGHVPEVVDIAAAAGRAMVSQAGRRAGLRWRGLGS